MAAELRRRGPVAAGISAGIAVHLAVAAVGVTAEIPVLWQMGFFWSAQDLWILLPEPLQPWAFAAARGAAYGALAGYLWRPVNRWGEKRGVGAAPATITALAAYLIAGFDPFAGVQHRLVAAALGAAVGRLTSLILRSRPSPLPGA